MCFSYKNRELSSLDLERFGPRSTLVSALRGFLRAECAHYLNNVMPKFFGMDCGLNLRNAVLEVYNNTTHENYRRRLWEIARQHEDVARRVHELRWSILTWCLYHVKRAVRDHAHKELPKTQYLTKNEASDVAAALHDHVRLAETVLHLETSRLVVELIAGSASLQAVLANPNAALHMRVAGNAVVLTLGSCEISVLIPAMPTGAASGALDSSIANPFFAPNLLDYFVRQWWPNDVYWCNAFVGDRQRKTDATSEITICQIKSHLFHGEVPNIRLDQFIRKDGEFIAGHIARVVDERAKLSAAGGLKFSTALLMPKTPADAADGWSKKTNSSVLPADIDVANIMKRAIDKLRTESNRKITQEDVRRWIMSNAFPSGNAAKDVDFTASTFFNSMASLSHFLRGERHMKTTSRAYAKRWAVLILNGSLTPHKD